MGKLAARSARLPLYADAILNLFVLVASELFEAQVESVSMARKIHGKSSKAAKRVPKTRTTSPRRKKAKKGIKKTSRASIAFRSSVALAHATTLFAGLHHRIQEFVLDDLKNYEDPPFDLRKPIPGPIFKEQVLEILLDQLHDAFANDSSWNVDPDKFHLNAKQLMNLTNGKSLSYFIQVIYQRAHDALHQ